MVARATLGYEVSNLTCRSLGFIWKSHFSAFAFDCRKIARLSGNLKLFGGSLSTSERCDPLRLSSLTLEQPVTGKSTYRRTRWRSGTGKTGLRYVRSKRRNSPGHTDGLPGNLRGGWRRQEDGKASQFFFANDAKCGHFFRLCEQTAGERVR